MRDSDESLFARYRNRGDVEALGLLFDRCAIDLFRIALYVGRNASDAEDLVQATFLSAIEGADRHDPERPVMPWLVGILTNHARRSRRQQRRELVPEMVTQATIPDPSLEAESSEIRATFRQALQSVSEPYRSVLTLHLDHGLTAQAISERLERPAGTVRSQVVRGLELLRRGLPAGLAGGVAMMLTPGHALAGVRAEVLRAAQRLAPATMPAASPLFLAKKSMLVAIACAIGLSMFFLLLPDDSVKPVGPSKEPTEAGRLAVVDGAGTGGSESIDPAHERAITAEAPDRGASGEFAIRLVSSSGQPLANLPCYVFPRPGLTEVWVVDALHPGAQLIESDDRGWVRAGGLAPGRYTVFVLASRRSRVFEMPPRQQPDSWVLPVPSIVKGTVRSADGEPVAGASVFGSQTFGTVDLPLQVTQTDEDGVFSFAAMNRSKTWVWSSAEGAASSVAVSCAGKQAIDLRLGRVGGRLVVVVQDPGGQPADAVVVGAFPVAASRAPRAPSYARTDAEGVASFAGLPPGECDIVVRGLDTVSRRRVVTITGGVPQHIDVRLEPGAVVRGRVTDGAGDPVVGRAVFAQRTSTASWHYYTGMQARIAYTDEAGRYELPGLASGLSRLRLVAKSFDREIATRGVTLGAGEQLNLDWVLTSSRLAGRVLGAKAGWQVCLIPVGCEGSLLTASRFNTMTAEDGSFSCDLPRRFTSYRVFVAPPGCPDPRLWYRASDTVDGSRQWIELDARGGIVARVRGRLPQASTTSEVAVRVTLARGVSSIPLTLDEAGRFETEPLPVDDYHITAVNEDGSRLMRSFRIDAESGRSGTLELGDLEWPATALLTVSMTPQAAAVDARVWIQSENGGRGRSIAWFSPTPVEVGEHWLHVAGPALVPQRHRLVLEPGDDMQRELRAEAGVTCDFQFPFDAVDNTIRFNAPLRISLRDEHGEVLVRDTARAEGESMHLRWQQALAPGKYHLLAATDWGGRVDHEFEVAAGKARIPLVLPVVSGQ